VTAREAQLARVAWILKGGVALAEVHITDPAMQKLCIAISDFMESEGMFFDYQARVDREAAAMEGDVT
jgi:hypothetical protein